MGCLEAILGAPSQTSRVERFVATATMAATNMRPADCLSGLEVWRNWLCARQLSSIIRLILSPLISLLLSAPVTCRDVIPRSSHLVAFCQPLSGWVLAQSRGATALRGRKPFQGYCDCRKVSQGGRGEEKEFGSEQTLPSTICAARWADCNFASGPAREAGLTFIRDPDR